MTTTTQTNQPNPASTAKAQPLVSLDHFPLRAAIWANHTREGDLYYSVTFDRTYKDGDDWKYTDSFRRSDLLALAKLADEADTQVRLLIDADRDARRPRNPRNPQNHAEAVGTVGVAA